MMDDAMLVRYENEIAALDAEIRSLKIMYDLPWTERDMERARCRINEVRGQRGLPRSVE